MGKLGIALDLGTSGFRAQAIRLDGPIISTAVTTRHPLPGANVIDHLHFALEVGRDVAHKVVVTAVNAVISALNIDIREVERMAVCGNPIQLSLFENIEIRDLAYAGKKKLASLGVIPPLRDARILSAKEIDSLDLMPETAILIPPAVQHEIGADALAMMIQTRMLEQDEISITTDYGTNAEMALFYKGRVFTGSTAAGPALEGQQIEDGLLALPGAISDINMDPGQGHLTTRVLNQDMLPVPGDTVDPYTGQLVDKGELPAVGITGTGVVALLSQGIQAGLIQIPNITTASNEICLPNGLKFTQADLMEAGKAVGSVRAGHITLCDAAGIQPQDIETAYMSGASGTYVDALKAQDIGMIPSGVKTIFQVGNTSLAMARDMVMDENQLWRMEKIAGKLRKTHCMFAASKVFERVYVLELAHWTEGMGLDQYQKFLKKYKLPALTRVTRQPRVVKTVEKDIPDFGEQGLVIIPEIGQKNRVEFQGCTGDEACVVQCPENALDLEEMPEGFQVTINLALCNGVACRRCERACNEKVFDLIRLVTQDNDPQA